MVGSRQLAQISDLVEAASGKLILIGDYHQLAEIDAGGLFAALVSRLPAVELAENVRVKEAEVLVRPLSLQVGVSWQDAVEGLAGCGRRWDEQETVWVASGPVAGAVLAPLLTSVRSAIVYVDADTAPRLEATAAQAG